MTELRRVAVPMRQNVTEQTDRDRTTKADGDEVRRRRAPMKFTTFHRTTHLRHRPVLLMLLAGAAHSRPKLPLVNIRPLRRPRYGVGASYPGA